MVNKQRLYELDSLRGIAAISVCLFHFGLFRFGCIGVDLFFVISGFVIFSSLNQTDNLKSFVKSRIIRLYPTYWLSIALAFFCGQWLGYSLPNDSVKNIIGNLTMLQPLLRAENFSGVFWTLYVEILFYLCICLIWRYNKFKNIELILVASLVLAGLINGLHLYTLRTNADFTRFFVILRYLVPLLSNIQFFAAGIAFYLIYNNSFNITRVTILVLTFASIALSHKDSVMINSFLNVEEHIFSCIIVYIVFVSAVFFKLRLFRSQILLFLGFISYPLYLVHDTVGLSLYKILLPTKGVIVSTISGIAIALSLAYLITILFDAPIRKKLRTLLLPPSITKVKQL